MSFDLTLLEASDFDFGAAVKLLEGSDLPVDDISSPSVTLWAAREAGVLAGVAGFERAGETGLLRSLAVAKNYQGQGLAGQLCAHVFAHARAKNLAEIYLLTTTAADYFPHLGFANITRDQAPEDLRRTAQFSSLCPASAAVMRKRL